MARQRHDRRRIRATDAAIFFLPCLLVAILYTLYHLNPALYWKLVSPEHFNPGFPALEWLQFGAYLSAAILSFYTSKELRSLELLAPRVICIFLALESLFVALEEISYGQRLFNLKLPSYLSELNSQGEVTVHNLKPFQPYLHRLYVAFGLIGGLGWLARWRCLPFSVRDLLFIELRFSLFFWQIAVYYLYLDQIDRFTWDHQEGPEAILAGGVFLVCLTRYLRSRRLRSPPSRTPERDVCASPPAEGTVVDLHR